MRSYQPHVHAQLDSTAACDATATRLDCNKMPEKVQNTSPAEPRGSVVRTKLELKLTALALIDSHAHSNTQSRPTCSCSLSESTLDASNFLQCSHSADCRVSHEEYTLRLRSSTIARQMLRRLFFLSRLYPVSKKFFITNLKLA